MIIVINIIIINSSSPPTSAPGGQHHPSTLVETEFEKKRIFLKIIWTALNPVTELHLSVSRINSLQNCMLVRLPCPMSNQCPVAVVFQWKTNKTFLATVSDHRCNLCIQMERPHKRCQIMHYSEENVRHRMFLPSSDPLITKPQKWNLHKVFCSNQGFLSYIAFVVIVVVFFVDALVVVIENRKSGIQTEFSSLIRDLIRDELCIHRPDRGAPNFHPIYK